MANILDPSTGHAVGVSREFQLKTVSEIHSLQHHNSWANEETYQVISVDTGITAKTQTIMHIICTSSTHDLVVSYIRMQSITSPTHPLVGDYFEMGFGRTVASGGTATTPVNMNRGSGKVAGATCTGIDPTMAGTFVPIDRQYIEADGKEYQFNKEGSLILSLNDSFEVRYLCSGTGESKCRVTFMMVERD